MGPFTQLLLFPAIMVAWNLRTRIRKLFFVRLRGLPRAGRRSRIRFRSRTLRNCVECLLHSSIVQHFRQFRSRSRFRDPRSPRSSIGDGRLLLPGSWGGMQPRSGGACAGQGCPGWSRAEGGLRSASGRSRSTGGISGVPPRKACEPLFVQLGWGAESGATRMCAEDLDVGRRLGCRQKTRMSAEESDS